MRHKMTPEAFRAYVEGGRGTVTARSKASGHHYTYKCRRRRNGDILVSVMAGSDNESPSSYRPCAIKDSSGWRIAGKSPVAALPEILRMASERNDNWLLNFCDSVGAQFARGRQTLTPRQCKVFLRAARNAGVGVNLAPPRAVKGWAWLMHAPLDSLERQAELWHEGTCGMCGRKLTNPKSLDRGVGPECSKALESAC